MTPVQHLRPTPGRTRTSRRAFAARCLTIVLGATLALSGCGTQAPDAAAIVDGAVISDRDVQTVSKQLNTLAQGEQQLSSSDALVSLILAPYVLAEGNRTGKTVTDDQVLKVIEKVADPSVSTVEFVRMQLVLQQLEVESKTAILSELGKSKITVNPRYGTFDAKNPALIPATPNWIKASATPPAK